jgi:hypothetical protein
MTAAGTETSWKLRGRRHGTTCALRTEAGDNDIRPNAGSQSPERMQSSNDLRIQLVRVFFSGGVCRRMSLKDAATRCNATMQSLVHLGFVRAVLQFSIYEYPSKPVSPPKVFIDRYYQKRSGLLPMMCRRWQCELLEDSRRRPKRICRVKVTEDGHGGGGDAEKNSLNIFGTFAEMRIWRRSAGVAAFPWLSARC